jgi:hypothetical protein
MFMSSPVPSDRRRVPRGTAERRNLSRRRPGIWTPAERERFIAEIREASPQMRRSPRFPPLATRPARASSAGHDISALGDVLAPVMAEDVATLDVLGAFPQCSAVAPAAAWTAWIRERQQRAHVDTGSASARTAVPDVRPLAAVSSHGTQRCQPARALGRVRVQRLRPL